MRSRGFRISDSKRNVMGQCTEMSPLVSFLFRTFLNPLKFFMELINILVNSSCVVARQFAIAISFL